MFLIAKIVRGRRLLHELEQAEKEKEKERERERLEAHRKSIRVDSTASTGSSSNSKHEKSGGGFTHHRRTGAKDDGDAKKKTVMLVENNENRASTSGENKEEPRLRRRKTWASADAQRALQTLRSFRKDSSWKRRNSIARASHSMMLDTILRKAGSADLWYQHSFTDLAHQLTERSSGRRRLIHSFPSSCSAHSLHGLNGISLEAAGSGRKSSNLPSNAPCNHLAASTLGASLPSSLPLLRKRESRRQSHRWSTSMEEAWVRLSQRLTAPCALPVDFSAVCIRRSFGSAKPKKRVRREYYIKNVMYNSKALRQKTDTSLGVDSNHELTQRMRRTSSMPSVVDAMHKTSMDRVRHYNYDLKLSKLQKRALRFTWHRLQTRNGGKRVDIVFEDVYDRLMRLVPVMKEMFTTRAFLSAMSKHEVATPRDHARFTVKMIDSVIKNLDTDEKKRTDTMSEFDPVLIGRAHAVLRPYGFVASIWEKLGETIIDVVLVQDAVRDLPGAGQAWVVLTACLVDQLRAGFEQNREYPKNRVPGRCPMHEMNKHTTQHQPSPHFQHSPHPQHYSPGVPQRSTSPILDLDQATEQLRQNSINRERSSPPHEQQQVHGQQQNSFLHQQSLPYPYMDEEVSDENVDSGNLGLNPNEQAMLRQQQEEDIRVAEALISGRYMDKNSEFLPRHHHSLAALHHSSTPSSQPITPHSSSPIHAPIASLDRSGSSSRCTSPSVRLPHRQRSPSHHTLMEVASLSHRAISSGAIPSIEESPSKARRRSQPVESRFRRHGKFY